MVVGVGGGGGGGGGGLVGGRPAPPIVLAGLLAWLWAPRPGLVAGPVGLVGLAGLLVRRPADDCLGCFGWRAPFGELLGLKIDIYD